MGHSSAVITAAGLKLHSTCTNDHYTHGLTSAKATSPVLSAFPAFQLDRCEKLCMASDTSLRGWVLQAPTVAAFSLAQQPGGRRASHDHPAGFEYPTVPSTGSLTAAGANAPATRAAAPNPHR